MPRPFLKFTNQTLLEKYMAVITAAMVKELRVKTEIHGRYYCRYG